MTNTLSRTRIFTTVLCAVAVVAIYAAGDAWGANPFVDIAGNSHAADIDAIYNAGITLGCTDATHYCPSQAVTRDQMASFLARTAALSSGTTKHFPVVNAKGPTQAYCALAAATPRSYASGPCRSGTATVDATNNTGINTSIAIGSDGLPIISYNDTTDGNLRVAHCANAACANATTFTTVDSTGNVGVYSSIAIGTDGFPIISYTDMSFGYLKVAHCFNNSCVGAVPVTVDATGSVGYFTSIAIGSDGFPIISYYDNGDHDLDVAHCVDNACANPATVTTIDSTGDVGYFTSMAIGTDGLPIITYVDGTNFALKTAHCANAACTGAATLNTVANVGTDLEDTAIAIGIDGSPIISYYNTTTHSINAADCANTACTGAATLTVVDNAADVGFYSSIAIGTDGLPVISYEDVDNHDLNVARCANAACTGTSTVFRIDVAAVGGSYTSIAIGTDGVPVVSYYDEALGDLKVARPPVT